MKIVTEKYRIITWRNPAILHWILNPGLAFNELVLGQRIPTVQWVERHSNKPHGLCEYIPCPHCDTLHPGMKWSELNGTGNKNWFGLYCDHCGQIIPCLWNLTSVVLLLLTSPLWFLFKKRMQARWLAAQPARFQNLILEEEEIIWIYEKNKGARTRSWLKTGMIWGVCMFVFMLFTKSLFAEDDPVGLKVFIITIILFVCLLFGLLLGFTMNLAMKLLQNRRK